MQLTVHNKKPFDKTLGDYVMMGSIQFRINSSLVEKFSLNHDMRLRLHLDEDKMPPNNWVMEFVKTKVNSLPLFHYQGALWVKAYHSKLLKQGLQKGYYTTEEVMKDGVIYYPLTFSAKVQTQAHGFRGLAVDQNIEQISVGESEVSITEALAKRCRLGESGEQVTYAFAQHPENPLQWFMRFDKENHFYYNVSLRRGRWLIRRQPRPQGKRAPFPPPGRYLVSSETTRDDESQKEFYKLIPII